MPDPLTDPAFLTSGAAIALYSMTDEAADVGRLAPTILDAIEREGGVTYVVVPPVPPLSTPRRAMWPEGANEWARARLELDRRAAYGPDPNSLILARAKAVSPAFAEWVKAHPDADRAWRESDGSVTWAPYRGFQVNATTGSTEYTVKVAVDMLFEQWRARHLREEVEALAERFKATSRAW